MSSASPLGKLLREFAERLGPDAEAEEAIDKIIAEISVYVYGMVGESLDRIAPLGSYAKKTALAGEMDLDLVLFHNREDRPPFADILEKLKGCFAKVKGAKNVTLKAHSLALNYKGMKVDILTAQNMLMLSPVLSNINDNVNQLSCVQHALTLQKIKQLVGKRRPIDSGRAWNISQVFSTSLSEAAEVFAKQQSSFGHTLAKLAKYWNKRIVTGIYFSARSSIIEYIAFWIAEKEEKNHPEGQDLYRAFREFLLYISQPEQINIYWCIFYREEDIPNYNRATPSIVDPTNPYNNLIYEKQLDLLKEIGKCAHVTLNRMQKCEDWDRIVPFYPLATTFLFWPQLTAELRQSLTEKESTFKPVLMDITNTNNPSKGSSELYHPGQKRSSPSHQDSKPSKSRRLTSLESSQLQSAVDCAVMVAELLLGKEVAGRFRRERQNQANFSGKHSLDGCLMTEVGLVILSGEQYSKIESIAKKISQFARQVKFRGTVVRVKLSGTYAKKTAISLLPSPVDIVVFLDCKGSPPYVDYLQEFVKVLREYFTVELVGDYLLVHVEDYIVRVKTGKNFAQSAIDIPVSQLNGVFRCKKTKKKQMLQQVQLFSASLSEAQVQFFEQRGSFSRKLAILAKLCMFHIIPDITDLFEMEVLVELLCVWVTENMKDKQIGKALEAFLKKIKKLKCVDIWWDDFYHLGDFLDVPETIPRVLDPTNPYLNFLQGKDDQFFCTMRNRASEMLQRLEEVKGYQNEHIGLGIFYLFSPTY